MIRDDAYDRLDQQHEQLKASIWQVENELRVAARGADEQGRIDWAIQLRDWANHLRAAICGRDDAIPAMANRRQT